MNKEYGILNDIEKGNDPYLLAASQFKNLFKNQTQKIIYPRSSTFYNACMRMHVIGTKLNISCKQNCRPGELLTFAIGNALHFWLQNSNKILNIERYGYWRCISCGNISNFGEKPKVSCKCGSSKNSFLYYEFGDVIKDPYMFSFHIDMFRKVGVNIYRVHEFKTIKKESFEKLKAPLIQHEYQVALYILGCLYSKKFPVKIDPLISYITYLPKGQIRKTFPLKTFIVKTNKITIQHIKNKLNQYKEGLLNYPNKIPSVLLDCEKTNFNSWTAKGCPVIKECKSLCKS